jgi:hypothetical protein
VPNFPGPVYSVTARPTTVTEVVLAAARHARDEWLTAADAARTASGWTVERW